MADGLKYFRDGHGGWTLKQYSRCVGTGTVDSAPLTALTERNIPQVCGTCGECGKFLRKRADGMIRAHGYWWN